MQSGAPAGSQNMNAVRQGAEVICVVLGELGDRVEADDEGLVGLRPHHLVQKFDGRLLLKAEALADGIAGIDQQAYAQRQSGLALKCLNVDRRLALVEQPNVLLLQVLDESAMFVRGGEDQIDQVD